MTAETSPEKQIVPTGSAAAAMIATGVGLLIVGLMTTGAVISTGLKSLLNWWDPAGPLTGKTGLGILAWLISWMLLNTIWRNGDYDLSKAFKLTLILIALGLALTFPPVFEIFG